MTRHRQPPAYAALGLSVLAALLLAVLVTAPAQAAAYRYWGFFTLDDGGWQLAQQGPAQVRPRDGDVEGWRFALGGAGDTRTPRGTVGFEEVCGDTEAASAKEKQVAVVLDYGRAADYGSEVTPPRPVAECATVPEDATAADVLASVAAVRSEKGLVCAVDDLPGTGCGEEVADVPAAAARPDTRVTVRTGPAASAAQGSSDGSGDGPATGTWIGAGAVVVLAAAAGVLLLRRRTG